MRYRKKCLEAKGEECVGTGPTGNRSVINRTIGSIIYHGRGLHTLTALYTTRLHFSTVAVCGVYSPHKE